MVKVTRNIFENDQIFFIVVDENLFSGCRVSIFSLPLFFWILAPLYM